MTLAEEAREKRDSGKMRLKPVVFSNPVLSGTFDNMSSQQKFDAIAGMTASSLTPSNLATSLKITEQFDSGFEVPMMWSDKKKGTVSEKLTAGTFMSSNTLPADWQNLWDAIRIDVTVKKAAMPTIRQFIYNIKTNPNYTRTLKPTELGRASIYFEKNNGHGQAVPQGEILGGGYETFDIEIYGAGFTWDLLGELFGMAITPDEMTNALIMGENALKDDLAISPIINFSYVAAALTAASTEGTARQEKLWNTLVDGRDDMRVRNHPATGRPLDTSNLIILASAFDAENILDVSKGLPSVQDKTINSLSWLKQVIAYEGETIELRDRTIEYDGVAVGTCFMLIPASQLPASGYMEIAVKRDLVVETDLKPNVNNLSREQKAWWFAEGIWYKGIQYFVQKITLPAW
jgi:hypothetical protein